MANWSAMGWRNTKRAGSAAFSPRSLTNLRGWWRSDTGITIATGVSQWNDQSGQNNHLVQATGTAQPVVTAGAINGLPAITFDGVDDSLSVAFALVQPETIFIVFSHTTWTAGDTIVDGTSAGTMVLRQQTATPGLAIVAGTILGPNNNLAVNTFGLATCIFNGVSSVLQINNTAETAGAAGASNGGGITLGMRFGGTAFAACSIAEVIVMAATATAGERANVKAYVAARYGIS